MRLLKIPLLLLGLLLLLGTAAWVFRPRTHPVEVAAAEVAASVEDGRGAAEVHLTGGLEPATLAQVRALEGAEELTQARERLEGALAESAGEEQEGHLCVMLSALARRQHDAEAAAEYGRRGAGLLPTNGSAHHVFAYALTEQMLEGGWLSALKNMGAWRDEVRLAIELDGNNVDARREEIFFYAFLSWIIGGDSERALELVGELEGVNLQVGRALRATILGHLDREEEALELCRTTLSVEPDDFEMHVALGGLLEKSEKPKEADAQYASATAGAERGPLYFRALYQRAQLRTGGGAVRGPGGQTTGDEETWDEGQALEFLDEYLADAPRVELMPPHSDAHWRRGVALEALQRDDEARAAYQAALSLSQDHGPATQALAALSMRLAGPENDSTDGL